MRNALRRTALRGVAAILMAVAVPSLSQDLPSWDGDAESTRRLVSFVERVSTPQSADFLPPEARIAVFDNDGTLWAEQPAYFQVLFAVDQAAAMLKETPELAKQSPFKELASGGAAAVAAGGEEALLKLILATHAGMTATEFKESVRDWLNTARHPTTGEPYTDMVYAPMLELLNYLRANDFTPWIVSGGGVDFMRVWVEEVYGIPPQHVIGSRVGLRYEDGMLIREAEFAHVNDKGGKPVGISQQLGRKPAIAVGNSDGDFAMLEWTTQTEAPALGILIRHTDEGREWRYDRDSSIGRLQRGLDEAPERGWIVVDMKKDWLSVFPSD